MCVVDFVFGSSKLAKLCSSWDRMVRAFGPEMARRLGARLNEVGQAESLAELRTLPHVRAHELVNNRDEQISLDLVGQYRLILEVADDPVPRLSNGGLDWQLVRSVVIVEIADTHR